MPLERETGERFVEGVCDDESTFLDAVPHTILSPRLTVQRFGFFDLAPAVADRFAVTTEQFFEFH